MKWHVAGIADGVLAKTALGVALAFMALTVAPLLAGSGQDNPWCLALAATAEQEARATELLDKGELAAASGRFTEAEGLWQRALQILPGWPPAQERLAELPHRRAVFAAEQVARERRSRARLALVEWIYCFNAGQYQAAAELFQACLEVFPGDELARHHLQACRRMLAELKRGSLYVTSDPQGRTPLIVEGVNIGRHKVSVSSCGADASRELEVKPRTMSTVSFAITGGTIEVICRPAAQIFLDGSYLGTTPLRVTGLPVGDHTLQVRRDGLPPKTLSVNLRGDSVNRLKLELRTETKGE